MIKRPSDILPKHLSLIVSCPILLGSLLVFLATNDLLPAVTSFLASSLAVGIVFIFRLPRLFDMRELAIHLLVDLIRNAPALRIRPFTFWDHFAGLKRNGRQP